MLPPAIQNPGQQTSPDNPISDDSSLQENKFKPKTTPIDSDDPIADKGDDKYVDPLLGKEDLQKALMDILHNFDTVEESNRVSNIRLWKKCENYWHHIQNMYWSIDANDWRSPTSFYQNNPDESRIEYDMKIVNIYRAHGESIVAALSVNTPTVRFFPEDADDSEDVVTSKVMSKISKMIERQNKAKLLLMRMIYILFNQGMIAVHNYSHESEEYGVRSKDIKASKEAHFTNLYCSACGEKLQELGPTYDKPTKVDNTQTLVCPACNTETIPEVENTTKEISYIAGTEEVPKVRQRIDAYGPLNVKISSYAYNQRSVGILVLDAEQNLAKAQEMYPEVADKFKTGPLNSEVSTQARMPNNIYESYQTQNVTVRQAWIRPWMFNSYSKAGNPRDNAIVQQLKEIFPHGCLLHAVNTTYAESYHENLDTAWSLSFNPLSRYLQGDPIGMPLMPIQDMTNEMVNLELQSIEYGIPETFVDPEVLDLDEYKDSKGGPGMVFPIKPQTPGADISKSFYQNKTSTLTDEASRLRGRLDADGQFVSGDYPSIYGGPNSGDTAAEYSMSRQQALQRLSITWTIINFLWADVMKNAVNGYVSNLKEDDHYVEQGASEGQFINIWIKKDELTGSIGEVYPEGSEQFPISWAQQREILMQLMVQQSPMVEAVLANPNNRSEVATLLGLTNFYIPGDQDRRKQLSEISLLLQADPINTGQPSPIDPTGFIPSVQPEEKIDDHMVHIETCKHWLNSEIGQYFKTDKPSKYMNVMLHMEVHMFMMMSPNAMPNDQPPNLTGQQPTDNSGNNNQNSNDTGNTGAEE